MTKICVLFLLPEHHKFSDPESRLKAVLCTQVPLNYANIGSFSQETLKMLHVFPVQSFTDMTEDESGQPFCVHAPSWAHWDRERTWCSSTKLEAKAMGENALDWELGDQDSTSWPTSKLAAKPCGKVRRNTSICCDFLPLIHDSFIHLGLIHNLWSKEMLKIYVRKAIPKYVQTTAQLHSSHTLAK